MLSSMENLPCFLSSTNRINYSLLHPRYGLLDIFQFSTVHTVLYLIVACVSLLLWAPQRPKPCSLLQSPWSCKGLNPHSFPLLARPFKYDGWGFSLGRESLPEHRKDALLQEEEMMSPQWEGREIWRMNEYGQSDIPWKRKRCWKQHRWTS